MNYLIRKLTPDGYNYIVSTIAGNESQGIINGQGIIAQFYSPSGITIDSANNLYVTDTYNYMI